MNRQEIANLTFKVVGLYCLIQAIPLIKWVLDIRHYGISDLGFEFWLVLLANLVTPALLAALGYLLLTRSHSFAARMFDSSPVTRSQEKILAIHAFAYSIVGIFAVLTASPNLVGGLLGFWFRHKQILEPLSLVDELRIILPPVVQTGLGLALFLGSHRLVRLWLRLRYAGVHDKIWHCMNCGCDLTGNTSGVCPECGTPTPQSAEA